MNLSEFKPTPSLEELHNLFEYDSATGSLYWKLRKGRCQRRQPAGYTHKQSGYVLIGYGSRTFKRSRLVWAYHSGDPGSFVVDHINGCRSDDRLENLRLATIADNARNAATPSTNTSGFKGVSWIGRLNKWGAWIRVDYKSINLGLYPTREEAAAAYAQAALKYHGEFARLT